MRRPAWGWTTAAMIAGAAALALALSLSDSDGTLAATHGTGPRLIAAGRTAQAAAGADTIPGSATAPFTPSGSGSGASTNWAGYAVSGARFTAVKASWRQPAADCAAAPAGEVTLASFWVGLDGYAPSKTVEQIGTESGCEGATPVYYAWLELYPHTLTLLSADDRPVQPGDVLHAEVTQRMLRLRDATAGWTEIERFSPASFKFSSAEWITEAPSRHLTDFGSVSFTSATASTVAAGEQPIDSGVWPMESIDLTGGGQAGVRARPGTIGDSPQGSTFAVRWLHG